MCFWSCLEILRLVYKKAFFKNIELLLSYLTFYPLETLALPLIRKFFEIVSKGYYIKEAQVFADYTKVHNIWVKKCPKLFP